MGNSSKLIAGILGQNCEKFLPMCLESVKDADKIVFLDGRSTDNTLKIAQMWGLNSMQLEIIHNKWNQEDKQMNGKQRNYFLSYVKEKYPEDWVIFLDADEVVEDLNKVKELIGNIGNQAPVGALSIKMRHFIGDLGHEDATRDTHWVPNRLFRISKAIRYPEHSHPILEAEGEAGNTDCTTIWHLGHLPIEYMKYIVKRSKQHKEDSIIHNKEFLDWWEKAHLFGEYPIRKINPREIPRIIYDELGIDFEEMYSSQERIEMKHHLMVKNWYDYFKPVCVLDLGCGRGAYLFYWRWFMEYCKGIDNNRWAIENSFVPGKVELGDCSRIDLHWDLITAIDLLEHLDSKKLDKTLAAMSENGNKFIFSIPFIGDPNLNADRTHKQFKTREEWIKLIESYGIKIKETPKDWLFANQILIGEK